MSGKGDRFRLTPLAEEADAAPSSGRRGRSPMAAAIAENVDSLERLAGERERALEALKADAVAYREAAADSRLDELIAVDAIRTDALGRDRSGLEARLTDDAMTELKASIRRRGLQNAIQVFVGRDGAFQLEVGWRRLMAFRALRDETGDPRFSHIRARVVRGAHDVEAAYGRMIDENLVRADVSFGEMALVAIAYARDPRTAASTADEAVAALFASAIPTKRSYIRRFVELAELLEGALGDPRGIARNAGVAAARLVSADPAALAALRELLTPLVHADPDRIGRCIAEFVRARESGAAGGGGGNETPAQAARRPPPRKASFRTGALRCTLTEREVRIVAEDGFGDVAQDRIEAALRAFRDALGERFARDGAA